MLKNSQKCLTALLAIVSIVTSINVLIMYWVPIFIPISSFSAVRVMVFAFIEKKYYLIIVGALICVLLFLSGISVRRQHILLPVLSLIYLIYDWVTVLLLLVDSFDDYDYWKQYVIHAIVPIALIVLLSVYCWNYLRYKPRNRH